ncbi:type II toxin-antitoxin system PemK/MazF family toxin [Bartonella sp. 220]|uniref:type II toxin-antitoxin system PemK/MazF family toxin n=1 Tax=Bartonella sp. 220B TaxID=2967260 RepID=UPI0022A90F6E|nr:type II toxin-antitoxin system PemK/MazF family toxin [Bartonella sp. 220B]MCZ2158736.1 type II toxin-antitoxin system PemK/MazF family toxin [Bartonella sp. 220B]
MAEDKNTTPSPLSPPPFDISQLEEPCVMMEHDYNAWREHTQKGDLNAPYKKPPHIKPRLKSAPRIRQVFWCDFPYDALLPEFWKKRPVLVLSKNAKLYGNVTVLPFSTKSQPNNPAAYPLQSPIENKKAWIICDYVTTVSVSRLSCSRTIPRISSEEFHKIVALMLKHLPRALTL